MKGTGGEEPVCGGAEARTRGCGRALIERRLDATGRRAGGPRGALRAAWGAAHAGEEAGLPRGGLRPWEGGSRTILGESHRARPDATGA